MARCSEHSRAAARAAGHRRGRPRPARDRAGDAGAGGHRPRPAQVRRARRRPRARRLRRHARCGPSCSTTASRPPPRRGRSEGARLRLPRRRRRRALAARPDRRSALPQAAAAAGAARRPGRAFAEDPTLRWHPSLAPLAELHGEGKVSVMPGIGYDHPNQSHFTSRHFWEVGAADERLATGWLGRYLDRVGSKDNPLQGLSLDWSLQPSLATATMPVAAVDAPDRYDFWARGVWGEVVGADARRDRRARRAADPAAIPASRRRATRRGSRRGSTSSSRRSGPRTTRSRRPARWPTRTATTRSRAASPGSRRCSPPACRSASSRSRRRAATTRTTTRRPTRRRAEADRRLAARLPARPRGARARRPRARPRLVGVRPPRRGERLGRHRPRRGRHRLPDRLARRRDDDRRVPRSRAARRDGNLRATADFRGLYAALIEDWLGADADRDHPGRREVPPAEDPAMRRPLALRRSSCSAPAPGRRRQRSGAPARAQVSAERVPAHAVAPVRSVAARRSSSSSTTARTTTTSRCAGSVARAPTGSRSSHPGKTGELERACGPAATRCGARSPTTAPAACARRCSCAERPAHQLPGDGGSAVPGGVIT